jgi:hypothetical protein
MLSNKGTMQWFVSIPLNLDMQARLPYVFRIAPVATAKVLFAASKLLQTRILKTMQNCLILTN